MLGRRFLIAGVSLLVLSLTACALDIPRFVAGVWKYGGQIKEGTLKIGDAPPELSVYDLKTMSQRKLAEWTGDKPLVLVFGSCT